MTLATRLASIIAGRDLEPSPVYVTTLAARAGVTRRAVYRWLCGRDVTAARLRALALATGRSADWLLGLRECHCGRTCAEDEACAWCGREPGASA